MQENFDYGAGTQFVNTTGPNGGQGWNLTGDSSPNSATSNWGQSLNGGAAANRTATSPGLTYSATGYLAATGNKLTLDAVNNTTSSQNTGRPLGGQTIDTGTTYFSLLMQKDVDTVRTMNWAFFNGSSERVTVGQTGANSGGVTNGSNGNICVIFQNQNPSGIRMGANPIPMGVGITHLILGRIDWDAAGNDTFTMWVDPTDVTSEAAAASALYYNGAEFDIGAITHVRPFMGNLASNPTVAGNVGDYDEFRIGGTWESVTSQTVVPEPASILSGIVGALGLGIIAHRCRRS